MAASVSAQAPAAPAATEPMPALLAAAHDLAITTLHERVEAGGYGDIRPAHGCVFRFVRPEGTRLTEMAERSGFTKQTVGEVVAKLVFLTAKGQRAQKFARRVFADIEAEWAERFGAERVADMRALLDEIAAS